MSHEHEVTHIRKRDNPHERIEALAGPDGQWSTDTVITMIRHRHRFWVRGRRWRVYLEIGYHNRRPYVRTNPNGIHDDNLLSLPEIGEQKRNALLSDIDTDMFWRNRPNPLGAYNYYNKR
jgi:hypothetical protein